MIKNLISIILRVGMILLSLGIVSSHANAQEKYKYVLEENEDKELCEHMTQVFNHNFQTPWDIGTLNPVAKYPKHFEKPYDQIFERLSGVKFNQDFTYSMLLAKYPSSPEFDEILWKEGRLDSPGLSSSDHVMKPTLITEIDLYNNGTVEDCLKLTHCFHRNLTHPVFA